MQNLLNMEYRQKRTSIRMGGNAQETPSKLQEIFLQAKIQKIKLDTEFDKQIQEYEQRKNIFYQFKRKPNSQWNKIRGLLRFLIVMKRVIIQKKLYGLSAQILYLVESKNEKKQQSMFRWISGNLEDEVNTVHRKPYLIYPDMIFLKIWNYIIFCLFGYTTLFVPYKIAFIDTDDEFQFIIDYVVNGLFCLDILVTIFTV